MKSKKISKVDSTVLILGETGVGKDFIATYTQHQQQKQVSSLKLTAVPYLSICSNQSFSVMKKVPYGCLKGGKKGLKEANGGTLYLDEIGDMPYFAG